VFAISSPSGFQHVKTAKVADNSDLLMMKLSEDKIVSTEVLEKVCDGWDGMGWDGMDGWMDGWMDCVADVVGWLSTCVRVVCIVLCRMNHSLIGSKRFATMTLG
jgi:hypothetical protein